MGLAITGIGMLSSCGETLDELYAGLKNAREEKMISVPKMKERGLVFTDSITKKAYAAMRAAAEVSGLECKNRSDMGIFIGTAFGSLASTVKIERAFNERGMKGVMPMDFMNSVMNAPAGQLAILSGLSGINITVSDGSASSIGALRMCGDMIDGGRIKAAVVGGIEEKCDIYCEYMKLNGQDPSEGVCMFIAEDADIAKERGAHIYAEPIGSAYAYKVNPSVEDMLNIMSAAAKDADMTLDDLDFIVKCGEDIAIENTHIKSIDIQTAVGNTYSAAGAFMAAAAAAVFEKGKLPDGSGISKNPAAMIISFGFDGFMGCCVLRKGDNRNG